MTQVHLLGGVAAVTDDGEALDLGPAKCRAVLAALAFSVGEAMSVSLLIDMVWGEDPPRTAEKTLQGYVARLRRTLGAEAIVRTGTAYRLNLPPDSIDAARFRRLLTAGDVTGALATWTGSPLVGVNVPGLAAASDGLVEQWLVATEEDLSRKVAADADDSIAALIELTAAHPFREELWALLMTALYRAGRQADALAAFKRAREHLVTELGIEPGLRLRHLERQILAEDESLPGQSVARAPGLARSSPRPGNHPELRTTGQRGNLPSRPGRLIGRSTDLATVAQAMESSPVVTLVGPGGIGKTTLALASARRCEADESHRVWLVELAEIASSDDVPKAVADTLGVTGGAGRSLTESVVAVLRSRPTLLVLDNCEHVIDGAAALASAVVDDAPNARVLATSREGLGIAGEQLIAVAPLDPAGAAVELFAERARAASWTFDLSAVRSEVEEICRQLDGLPLAIELAAARTTSLTPAQLLTRLDRRLRLLGGDRRTTAQRHRTLRATVQWSYDLLTPAQQTLFEQLAVFVGPFDLAAAEAVASGAEQDVVDTDQLLGDLVTRSMVTVEAGPLGRRFRLLETLRQFAMERLFAGGSLNEVAQRHANWCRDEIAHIGRLLVGAREADGVARLADLWTNLRAAVDWACRSVDVDLADALVRPIAPEVDLRRQAEIGEWAEQILNLTPADDEARVVFWLLWAGHRHARAGDHEALEALVQRHGHADHPVVRFNHNYLSEIGEDAYASSPGAVSWLRERGENHAADLIEISGLAASLMTLQRFPELAELAADMAERHGLLDGPPTLRYFALGMQGYAAQYQGFFEDAAEFFTAAEATELPAGTYRVIQTATARMAFEQGDRKLAYRTLHDNIEGLLDSDYTDVTRMVAVEFITMMGAIDHLAAAAAVLTYLDTTGDYGKLVRQHLVPEVVQRIECHPDLATGNRRKLDAHGALTFMRDALADLCAAA